eukprot:TRINITY_DN1387_c0_g1_i1.p1 TRINITY_DN1387_c0_g1~~TRINITY_DN1387_c0_g1_i1.p1  ORF type:complete len:279 (-),score=67.67 TRINITY_DN1387_c0_g1_i1:105-941(-)
MPTTPKVTRRRRARSFPSPQSEEKVKRVLGDPHHDSIGKLSELLGVDEDTLHEINLEQVESECRRTRTRENKPKRNSKKALERLGYDPSTEKIKQMMGLDDQDISELEQFHIREHELKIAYLREMKATVNKRKSHKALDRLGVDVSIHKASRLLGAKEDIIREAHHTAGLEQDAHIRQKRLSATLMNKKDNKKAFHVVGYDPSLEKVADVLGVEVGSPSEAELKSLMTVDDRVQIIGKNPGSITHPSDDSSFTQKYPSVTLGLTISTLAFVAFQVMKA